MLKRILAGPRWVAGRVYAFILWTGATQPRSVFAHGLLSWFVTLIFGPVDGFIYVAIFFASREIADAQHDKRWSRDNTEDLVGALIGSGLAVLMLQLKG